MIKRIIPLRRLSLYFLLAYIREISGTKEFTANPLVADSVKTGDFTKFSDITYEFSTDGTNWTTLAADLRKDELTPGSTYYVKPKYPGTGTGESDEFSYI